MSKFEHKAKISMLRKKGMSIKEIAKVVPVSVSTISSWCRDIVLTDAQKIRLHEKMIAGGHKGRMLGALANHKKKEISVEACKSWAGKTFNALSERDFLMAGISLYWAEGSKSDKHQLSFVNSDPMMIVFMYRWFRKFFNIVPEDFIVRVFINEMHETRIGKVLNFWSHLLELPRSSFRKTIFIKTKQRKVYANYNDYHGLLALRVKRSSLLKYKIIALVDLMRNAGVAQSVVAWDS